MTIALPDEIQIACATLRQNPNWDVDESMSETELRETPLGQLLSAFEIYGTQWENHRRLGWLATFAARRALPCWELYCDGNEPHQAIQAIEEWLINDRHPNSWEGLAKAADPSFRGKRIRDCRECDTGCAAEAAARAARFAWKGNPIDALSAVSFAEAAFDQSPLGSKDDFSTWSIEIAILAAYQCRGLSIYERNLYRSYNPDEIPLDREKYARFWH